MTLPVDFAVLGAVKQIMLTLELWEQSIKLDKPKQDKKLLFKIVKLYLSY